jgi:hypothetical protein
MEIKKPKNLVEALKSLKSYDWSKGEAMQIDSNHFYPLRHRFYAVVHVGQHFYDWSEIYLLNELQTLLFMSSENTYPTSCILKSYCGNQDKEEKIDPDKALENHIEDFVEIVNSRFWGKYLRSETHYYSGDYSIEILNPDKVRGETGKEFYFEILYGKDHKSRKWYGSISIQIPTKSITGVHGYGTSRVGYVYEGKLHGVYDTPGFNTKEECLAHYAQKVIDEMHGMRGIMDKYKENIEILFPKVFHALREQLNRFLPVEKQKGQVCLF